MAQDLRIAEARREDVGLLLAMINELAAYERLANEVVATENGLAESLFGAEAAAKAIVAYWGAQPAGFAIYFHNFSTFVGRPGLYLEDMYVRPSFRRRGIARAIMRYLAKVALQRGCGRFEWWVLDWNESAIRFYEKLGAEAMSDWTVYRLSGTALERLGRGEA